MLNNSVIFAVLSLLTTGVFSYVVSNKISYEKQRNIFYTGKYEYRMLFIWCLGMIAPIFLIR